MNKNFLFEQIKKREAFEKAYLYAIAYRIKQDSYCNFIEIDYYRQNKEKLFEEIQLAFDHPQLYEAETAFSFYLPKSDMFFRRMIHTPFKDLVIKFIFVTVLADFLDFTLIKNCFSYRLKRYTEKDKKSKEFLYQYYYDGFQEFVNWQLNQVEENICMLKTDISSFYDSISHEYLLAALSKQIHLEKDSIFITLFSKTLKFKICYYSIVDGRINETYNSQGIPIGNEAEGFIANIFLKEADEALFNLNINFGRYVDDFRIFTNSKNEAIKASIILQEYFLKVGINLNAAKTKIVEAKEKIIEIIKQSKTSVISEAYFEDEDTEEKVLDKTDLINEIDVGDVSLQDNQSTTFKHQNIFDCFEDIDNADKARDFCKFLNKVPLGCKLETEIFSKQMEWLHQLSIKYPKHWKLYSWLFVKFLYLDYDNEIQFISLKYLFKIFDDEMVNTFIKTRILHHLVKPRKGALTYIERISTRVKLKERILEYLMNLMRLKCIALQLNCIYAFYLLDKDHKKLQEFVSKTLQRPIPEPIQYAVYQIGTLCVKGSPPLVSFEEILEESDIENESENFIFQ
jgi:hypothetical protein